MNSGEVYYPAKCQQIFIEIHILFEVIAQGIGYSVDNPRLIRHKEQKVSTFGSPSAPAIPTSARH